jgi:outer membrane protein assembly factor BamE
MQKFLTIILVIIALSSSGCTTYKLEIQQGNVVPQSAVAQLKLGMSKAQVMDLLGTPLLQDDFQSNRWDYLFYLKTPDQKVEKKDLVLTFKGDSLASIQ